MKKYDLCSKINIIFLFVFLVITGCNYAPVASNRPTAITTVYYLPDAKNMCGQYGDSCDRFLASVQMQGSGRIHKDTIVRAAAVNKYEKLHKCSTTIGSGGICLIPYISVAADRKQYNIGDIIFMPAIKGLLMTFKNGKSFKHPGYFLIHDTGGGINGVGRFDIFTGDMDLNNKYNSFGYKGLKFTKMYSKETYSVEKKFEHIRTTSVLYAQAKEAIKQALVQN